MSIYACGSCFLEIRDQPSGKWPIVRGDDIADGEIVVANAGTSLRDGDVVKTIYAEETEQARAR